MTAHGTQRTAHSTGQAIVEYLLIAGAVILAVVALKGQVQSKARAVMQGALDSIPSN